MQNLVGALLNMVDNVMVGGLGETAMAAVGIGNQIFFIFAVVLFGITSGLSVFIAQFWGSGRVDDIRRAISLGLILCTAFSLAFTVVTLAAPEMLMSVFTNDTAVIRLGADYLSVVAFGYPLSAISMVYSVGLRSTEKPVLPLAASVLSLMLNTVLNYLLIYGNFGFPDMGVRGAALATVIARIAEIIMIVFMVYRWRMVVDCYLKDFLHLRRKFVLSILRLALPVIANESLWVLGVSVFSAVYGRMGTPELAAYNVVSTLERLSFVLVLGLGNGCAVIVGKILGEGDNPKAYLYAKRSITLAPLTGIVIGILMIAVRNPIIAMYDIQEIVKSYAASLILISALVFPIKSFNFTNMIGVLRAGGDTRFMLAIDTIPLWLAAVPLSIVTGLYLKWPLPYVYLIIFGEELLKAALGLWRFFSRKWMNNLAAEHPHLPDTLLTEALE
ncbi:MAG: MATE family efflux transporter [Saccharofermentanales bacterium]